MTCFRIFSKAIRDSGNIIAASDRPNYTLQLSGEEQHGTGMTKREKEEEKKMQ